MDESKAQKRFESALKTYNQSFETFFVAKLLGLEFFYEDNACIVTFPVENFLFNPQGTFHGGMLATVMDISMGHLINREIGKPGFTLEMKNQFLRPLTKGPASCRGRFIRKGRSISFL
ncbi:MAG: PaaI family thioesterase, partial [Pseudomonadota bacterium]|nr:PaaI family thioesterase [Pseudomonadota bacterium]